MLHIDIETRSGSGIDLKKSGVYRYTEDVQLLLFGYAIDKGEPVAVDVVNGETIPETVLEKFFDPNTIKVAHNANFERTCLAKIFNRSMPPEEWICTAVWAAYAGLPRSLGAATKAAGTEEKLEKKEATRLLNKFCRKITPCTGSDWEAFKAYNIRDIVAEQALFNYLLSFTMPREEWELWYIDQHINDRGFLIDLPFVQHAVKGAADHRAKLMTEAAQLTGLENPNSVAQLKVWFKIDGSLDKSVVKKMLADCADQKQKRMLELRQQMALSSISKYEALLRSVCSDNRIRGSLLHYGAHTGRWSGRLFQPHNLPRLTIPDADFAHELVKTGEWDMLDLLYGDRSRTLSALVRSSVTAPQYLHVLDYSQIEARVCCWLAHEEWALKVFRNEIRGSNGKPIDYYKATYGQMYHISADQVTKAQRDKGKIAALLLQYQGSIGALTRADVKMTEEEMLNLVDLWRKSCPNIVWYWSKVNEAAIAAVNFGQQQSVDAVGFHYANRCLYIDLPSGRSLIFQNACMADSTKTGDRCVECDVEDKGKVGRKQLYGGLITENIVQALSRDILADHIRKCKDHCVLHVHDEVVLEDAMVELGSLPPWCADLPIDAKSFTAKYYRKD